MKRRTKFVRLFCLISLGGIMGGVLFGGVDGVWALDYQSNVGVGFTFNPSLSVSLSSGDLMISGLALGVTGISNEINVAVSTNIVEGYTLSATVGNGSIYNGDSLYNSADNTKTFANIAASADLTDLSTDNTWGYSYKDNTVATPAWSNYNGLPLYSGTAVALLDKDDASSGSVDFKIAAKAGSSQASGEYNNVINFTAVSNTIPTTMLDAFIASGAKMHNGYFKMQDMTPTICKSIDTDGEKGMQLIDVRDDKVYWVAKLKDGNCWMTQNLDLDIVTGSTSLTSDNTDLSTNNSVYTAENTIYSLKGTGDTYGYTYENGVATWIPERTTIAYNQLNSTNWQNSNTDPYSYDYLDSNGNPVYPDSNVTQAIAGDHGLSGNYYNWTASLASNDSANATGNPTNSICPKGWRLPNSTNREFGNLLVQYNIISTNTSASYINGVSSVDSMGAAPLYFVRGGSVFGGGLNGSGSNGLYWSSTLISGSSAFSLYYNSSIVFNDGNTSRDSGWSVRCLAR